MVTEIAPITFQYSHTIGRQENRSGTGFFYPVAITRDDNNLLYVLNRGSETPAFFPCKRVTVFTLDEELVREFGQKVPPEEADASAPDGSFMWPTSVALDKAGNAYVADEWLNRISIFNQNGECTGKWGTLGDGDGEFNRPSGMAFDAEDNLYLVDSGNHRVQIFTKDGRFLSKWGQSGNGDGEFSYPWGIEIDHHGDVYVADWRNDRIQKFAPDGRFLMKFGTSGQDDGEFYRPTGVAVDKDGIIYVTDFKNDRLQVFDADGRFITKLTGEATLSKWGRERVELDPSMLRGRERAQGLQEREKLFHGPIAVEVDDEGRVFVVECARQRLQVFRKQTAIFNGGPL
ncbi:MAG: 6-bladed beta-propeller [Chloroflexi bacterium]|nr:6-bladed beta-propeller [Chloroflexota bacterium]MDA1220154.1 6-bladed beta-propeller [Chloroflexota bacterium]